MELSGNRRFPILLAAALLSCGLALPGCKRPSTEPPAAERQAKAGGTFQEGAESQEAEEAPSGSVPEGSSPLSGPVIAKSDLLTEEQVSAYLAVRMKAAEIAKTQKDAQYPLAQALQELGESPAEHQRVSRVIERTIQNQVRRRMSGFATGAMEQQLAMVKERAAKARDPESKKQAEEEVKAMEDGMRRIKAQTGEPGETEAKNIEILAKHQEEFAKLQQAQAGSQATAMPGAESMPAVPPPMPPPGAFPERPRFGPGGRPMTPGPPGGPGGPR